MAPPGAIPGGPSPWGPSGADNGDDPAAPIVPATGVERIFAPPDVNGPRSLLGLLWVMALLPAAIIGVRALVPLFGGVAACAAYGTAKAWKRAGYDTDERVAAGAAALISLIAAVEVRLAGVLIAMALPVVAILVAAFASGAPGRAPGLATAGAMLRSVVPPCAAVIGVVLVAGEGAWSLLVFFALVSAYDAGHFFFGAESTSPVPGILAGAGCAVVAGVPAIVSHLAPFYGRWETLVFAGLVGVVAPLGQIVASFSLPTAAVWVGPLRRLDTYIIAGPLFAWVLTHYLAVV